MSEKAGSNDLVLFSQSVINSSDTLQVLFHSGKKKTNINVHAVSVNGTLS